MPSKEDLKPASDDVMVPGKYNHLLSPVWFYVHSPLAFHLLFSKSISGSTPALYMPHVHHWLEFARLNSFSLIDLSLSDIALYISSKAQTLLVGSVHIALSSLPKFFHVNLSPTSVLNHPTLADLITGLDNLPCLRWPAYNINALYLQNKPSCSQGT